MKKKRIIAIFSGNRAEYGLMVPIIEEISKHPKLEYKLLVSGAHLDKEFGKTLSEIKNDGFKIYKEVSVKTVDDVSIFTPIAIGSVILNLSKELKKIKPDIFLVYADRFESFAAIIASSQMNIPTVHIEGGDITEGGALDDSVRHAMTKLSHFHFTTNDQATNRIMAMGEEKWRVKKAGFPAIDLLAKGSYASVRELKEKFNVKSHKPIILFTQHSVTTEYELAQKQLLPSISALKEISKENVQIIITYPNNDVGGSIISKLINSLNKKKFTNINIYKSLGRYNYHGILALSRNSNYHVVCVGNSSSGIKETPFFGCPTINIGSRQKGRLRADNVIDVNYKKEEIISAIKKCINNKKFINKCKNVNNPYGGGNAGKIIAKTIANIDLTPSSILRKKMTLKGIIKNNWFK